LFVLGLGIPLFALVILCRKSKELNLLETKAKFGFLYNGYRSPQAYFWEIVIMTRKIVIIFI